MNGQPALCGDVLISSALIMNGQRVVQRTNNAGGDRKGAKCSEVLQGCEDTVCI